MVRVRTTGPLEENGLGGPWGKLLRLVVVDDDQRARMDVRASLRDRAEFVIVAATEGRFALTMLAETRPHVVLMDTQLRTGDGLRLLRRLTQDFPAASVVVQTGDRDEDGVLAALDAGARGYLLKTVSADELARAVLLVAAGEVVIDPALGGRLAHGCCPTSRLIRAPSRRW